MVVILAWWDCWENQMRSRMGRCLLPSLLPDKRRSGNESAFPWPLTSDALKVSGLLPPSLPEMAALTLLVFFLERRRIRDKVNPLSARSAHKLWRDENILIQTKESQVQRNVLRIIFPSFSPILFPLYLALRWLLREFITSRIFKGREPEVSLALSFQGKSPQSVWYVREWHERKTVCREGETMPRIVNYAKKKNHLSKRAMCLALFPRWSSAFWLRPLPDSGISGSALGLGSSSPPVTTGHWVSWGSVSTCSTSDSCGICALICLEATLIVWVLWLGDNFQGYSGLVMCYTQH